MPPKPKYTREEIIRAALNIVATKGPDALTAKELGSALSCSASPIFTVFNSMQEVQDEVRRAAMDYFQEFKASDFEDLPHFKRVGMKMVTFGIQEPKLFQLLFMTENRDAVSFGDIFSLLGPVADECMESIREEYGLNEKEARLLFENVWIYTFGVGALCATRVCHFSEATLGEMLTTQFTAMMHLIHARRKP